MKLGANVKKQAVQIAKQTAEEVLKEPKRVFETAGSQTGMVPVKHQEEQSQPKQDIQVAKQKDQVFAKKRIEEIEGELVQIRREREKEEREKEAFEIEKKQIQEQEKPKKPFFQVPGGKKKRGTIPQRVKKHSGTSEMRIQE